MSEMKTLMEVWRKKVLEPYEQEQEKEQELTVDVEAVPCLLYTSDAADE